MFWTLCETLSGGSLINFYIRFNLAYLFIGYSYGLVMLVLDRNRDSEPLKVATPPLKDPTGVDNLVYNRTKNNVRGTRGDSCRRRSRTGPHFGLSRSGSSFWFWAASSCRSSYLAPCSGSP